MNTTQTTINTARKSLRELLETKLASTDSFCEGIVRILREWPALAEEKVCFLHNGTTLSALPLLYCLVARTPLAVLKEVYEINPAAMDSQCELVMGDGSLRLTVLHMAAKHNASAEVLAFLAGKCNEDACFTSIQDHRQRDVPNTLPVQCLLAHHCPNASMAQIRQRDPAIYDKIRILLGTEQAVAPSLFPLLANLLPEKAILDPHTPLDFVAWEAQTLAQRTNYPFAKFKGATIHEGNLVHLLHYLSFLNMDYDFNLSFQDCTFTTKALQGLLSHANSPRLIVWCQGLKLQGSMDTELDWSKSRVHKLELNNCSELTGNQLEWFLQGIPSGLTDLILNNGCQDDCTDAIKAILANPRQGLDKLTIQRTRLDANEIAKVLEDMLTSTLFMECNNSRQLRYRSALNRCATQHNLHHLKATTETLVECLMAQDTVVPSKAKASLPYGLLRQCPSLWA